MRDLTMKDLTMRHLFAVFFLLMSGFIMRPDCMYDDGDCMVSATYYSSSNTTYWSAACGDGYVGNGAVGGNATSGICGG